MNSKANMAMGAGLAAWVLGLLGCVIPLIGMLGFIAAFAGIGLGVMGLMESGALGGEGKPQAIVGIASGTVFLITYGLMMLVGLAALGVIMANS